MGDGPDWRQLDRQKLQAARAKARAEVLEEWAAWLDESAAQALTFIKDDSPPVVALVIIDICASLGAKSRDLRARLSPPAPETFPAREAETKPEVLAEEKSKA